MVGALAIDKRPVDVVGPDGGECAHVARHSRHEACDQRCNSKPEQPGATVAGQHKRENVVITMAPSYSGHRLRNQLHRQHGQADQSRKDHDERNRHLECGADDGRYFRAAKILRGQNALHHQEVRSPVTGRDHHGQPKHNAGPMNSHWIVGE